MRLQAKKHLLVGEAAAEVIAAHACSPVCLMQSSDSAQADPAHLGGGLALQQELLAGAAVEAHNLLGEGRN